MKNAPSLVHFFIERIALYPRVLAGVLFSEPQPFVDENHLHFSIHECRLLL